MKLEESVGMPVFKSYMPLRAGFDELINSCFTHVKADEQRKLLEQVFYAGASSAYAAIINNPLGHETVMVELADHADLMAKSEKVS